MSSRSQSCYCVALKTGCPRPAAEMETSFLVGIIIMMVLLITMMRTTENVYDDDHDTLHVDDHDVHPRYHRQAHWQTGDDYDALDHNDHYCDDHDGDDNNDNHLRYHRQAHWQTDS